jgi:hypothetical protein
MNIFKKIKKKISTKKEEQKKSNDDLVHRVERFISYLDNFVTSAQKKFDALSDLPEEEKAKRGYLSSESLAKIDREIKFLESVKSSFELQLELEKSYRDRVCDTPFYGIITHKSLTKFQTLLNNSDHAGFKKYYAKLIRKFEKINSHLKS